MITARCPLGRPAPSLVQFLFAWLLFFTWPLSGQEQKPTAPRAAIAIDAEKPAGTISPLLYGQFLEYMFQCIKGGLHAELIRNRSFEDAPDATGLPRYWEPYPDRRDDDSLSFASDQSTSYPDRTNPDTKGHEHCLRVDVHRGVITRHGFCQSGIPVRKNAEYEGYFWLKTDGYGDRITVALEPEIEGGEPYAEAQLEGMHGDWAQYRFRLRSRAEDPLARLVFLFSGNGRVWFDDVSLMPADAVDGVRSDVFERVRALKPAFMRWPGGNVAQDYHWEWGIGPRDQRITWTNISWAKEPEPSDFGTDEYLRFCKNLGTRPTIVVNIDGPGETAELAAAWVEYCNGPAASKFGAMRAANGHPEPYHVHYWELGNEIWGTWVRAHSDAETYARNYLRYQAAMRAVDPTIEFIACGDNDMNWNRTVLSRAGSSIDFLAIHHYYGGREMGGDVLNLMAHPLHYETYYRQVAEMIRTLVPSRPIKLAINEWGLALPAEQLYSMDGALYAARMLNVFERSSDLVAMTSVSDLVNGWTGGIIQANRHRVFVTSIYQVNKLYNERLGSDRLATDVQGPVFASSREGRAIPYLDATASRSADGKVIYLKAVNTNRRQPLETTITLKGAAIGSQARVETIGSTSPGAFNHFATPDAVSIRSSQIKAGDRFTLELPPGSVSVLTLDVLHQAAAAPVGLPSHPASAAP